MNFKVKYVIKPNHVNKSYDVFEKDWRGGLTFHSHRDTYEEAQEVVDDFRRSHEAQLALEQVRLADVQHHLGSLAASEGAPVGP